MTGWYFVEMLFYHSSDLISGWVREINTWNRRKHTIQGKENTVLIWSPTHSAPTVVNQQCFWMLELETSTHVCAKIHKANLQRVLKHNQTAIKGWRWTEGVAIISSDILKNISTVHHREPWTYKQEEEMLNQLTHFLRIRQQRKCSISSLSMN